MQNVVSSVLVRLPNRTHDIKGEVSSKIFTLMINNANFLSDARLFLPIKTQKVGHKYVFDHYKGSL